MQTELLQELNEEEEEGRDFDAEVITEDLSPVSELMQGLTTELVEGRNSPSIAQLSCVEKFSKEQLRASVTELSLFLFRLVRDGFLEDHTTRR